MTPYYEDGAVTIYHGDCREIIAGLTFDAVVTDPPYGINLDTRGLRPGGTVHSAIANDDQHFDPQFLLTLSLPMILWGGNHYCDKLTPSPGWLVWNKVIYDGAFGSKSMDKKQAEAEFAWTNCVPRPKGLRHLWDGVFRDSESGTRFHPAQKPVALMAWCIQQLPSGCDVILDPYCGSGPTLRAAKNLGKRAIGIEIEERYCAIAVERLGQEVLDLAV